MTGSACLSKQGRALQNKPDRDRASAEYMLNLTTLYHKHKIASLLPYP